MSFTKFLPLLFIFGCVIESTDIAGQRAVKCRRENKEPAPRYRIGWKTYSVEGPRTLFLAVSVKPSHFSRDHMVALAHRIKADYCHEQRLVIAILDDYGAARAFAPTNEKVWFKQHWRGDYFLDRGSGEEELSFSTTPDKPKNEVKLNLSGADSRSKEPKSRG